MTKNRAEVYGVNAGKLFIITLLLFSSRSNAWCQIDLKNSLYDLKTQYNNAQSDLQKLRTALIIGSFYLTNKEPTKATSDSARLYAARAESLNTSVTLKEDADAIKKLKIRILFRNQQVAGANKMISESSGKLYCDLHFLTGIYFLEKPGEEKADLDVAQSHFQTAEYYAEKHGMPNTALISRVYLYSVMDERGTDEKGSMVYFFKVLALCQKYKAKQIEVKLLEIKAINDLNHYNLTGYLSQTITKAMQAGDQPTAIRCLKELADYNLRQGKIDTAERQLHTVIKMYQAIGYRNLQFAYDLLTGAALVKGNMEGGMKYSLATVKAAESTGTDRALYSFYNRVASLCNDLGLKSQSLMWYRKWQELAMKSETSFPYSAYKALATELISLGKTRQVLKTLDSAEKAFKYDSNSMVLIPQLRAGCYSALGMVDSAAYYHFSIIRNLENRGIKDYLYYQAYQDMAAFYIKLKKFEQAAPYVDKTYSGEKGVIRVSDMAELQLFKFKIDSSRGNYLSAINHFEASKNLSDSIYNHVKIKQTEQLQLQYATAERDRENLQLRNSNNLQQSELEKAGLNRKLISMALIGLFLVSGLLLYLYIAKRKSNTLLKIGQDEIHKQNGQLNQLLLDKEWLIKEVHHRVKNNLQIISSLLNTQSSFLDNQQALTAIRDSQNRMQAISIVHQKLYQSEDLSTIHLPVYIQELARSIQDSFQTTQKIKFKIDIAEANLDTAQTVPLGLILNEAITNSVKYAFTELQTGTITLTSSIVPGNNYQLSIKDNGSGLPDDFDIDACASLGMNLIAGLTEQLGGNLKIHSDGGTVITITFPLTNSSLS